MCFLIDNALHFLQRQLSYDKNKVEVFFLPVHQNKLVGTILILLQINSGFFSLLVYIH